MIRNLTPHAITVCGQDGAILRVIPPDGQVARVSVRSTPAGDVDGLPACTDQTGEVTGLPEPVPGVWLLVSLAVRSALPGRSDLVSPGDLIRGPDGQPVGCKGLKRNR
jgi:hypothetical protein